MTHFLSYNWVDLPIDCRTPDTWDTCPEWTCEAEKWGKIGYAAGASATMDKYDPPRPDQDVGGHKVLWYYSYF